MEHRIHSVEQIAVKSSSSLDTGLRSRRLEALHARYHLNMVRKEFRQRHEKTQNCKVEVNLLTVHNLVSPSFFSFSKMACSILIMYTDRCTRLLFDSYCYLCVLCLIA